MAARSGKRARIRHTSGTVASTTDAAFAVVAGSTVAYQVTSTSQRHWDKSSTRPVVSVGGATSTGAFTVDYVQGIVTFTTSPASAVTADIHYFTSQYLPDSHDWSLTVDVDSLDRTAFSTTTADVQWRSFTAGLSGWSVDIGQFIDTTSTSTPVFFDFVNTEEDLVVELVPDGSSGERYQGWCRVGSLSPSVPLAELADQSVTLFGDGPLVYSTTT